MSEERERQPQQTKRRQFFVIGGFLLAIFFIAPFLFSQQNARAAAAPPSILTYQAKLLANGLAATTTQSVYLILYDALTSGNVIYTAAGTIGAPSALSLTPSSGLFSVDLGGSGTNSLSPDIFANNAGAYLEIRVGAETLSPRKQITAAPYAFNSVYLNGVAATSTASSSTYIPVSDSVGNFSFNRVTSTGAYVTGASTFTATTTFATSTFSSSTITTANITTANILGNSLLSGTLGVTSLSTFIGGFISNTSSSIGAQLQVAGPLNASSTLLVGGAATLNSTLGVNSLATLTSGFISSASSSIGSSLNVTGNLNASGTLFVGGNILAGSNNALDIGSITTAFRNIYASSSLHVGSGAASSTINGNYFSQTDGTTSSVHTATSLIIGQQSSSYNQGVFVIDGSTTGNGAVSTSGTLTVGSTGLFSGTVTVGGGFGGTVVLNTNGTLSASGLAALTAGFISNASSSIGGALTVNGVGLFTGNLNASSSVFLSGVATTTPTSFAVNPLATLLGGFISNASSSVGAGLQVAGALNASGTLQVAGNTILQALTVTSCTGCGGASADWIQQQNFGVQNLTASTTLPYWAKSDINASTSIRIGSGTVSSTLTGQYFSQTDGTSTTIHTPTSFIIGQKSSGFNQGVFFVNGAIGGNGNVSTSGTINVVGLSTLSSGFISNASSSIGSSLNVSGNLNASGTLFVGGNIVAGSNNALDIGSINTAFRNIYASSSFHVGVGSTSSTITGQYFSQSNGTTSSIHTPTSLIIGQKSSQFNNGTFRVEDTAGWLGTISASGSIFINNGTDSADTSLNNTISISDAGKRLMWIPDKAAFRAGWVSGTGWDEANVGRYSTAFGKNSIAIGHGSFAAGSTNTANNDYDVAIGSNNTVSGGGAGSVAIGANNTANSGYAFGSTNSTSNGGMALGFGMQATGVNAVGVGQAGFATGAASLLLSTNSGTVSGAQSILLNMSASNPVLAQASTIAMMGGNVGVGTITPGYALTVSGTIATNFPIISTGALTVSSTNATTTVGGLGLDIWYPSSGDFPTGGVVGDLSFRNDDYFSGAIRTIGTANSATARMGFFTFAGANRSDLLERLTILDGGNVGIGTTTPAAKLNIIGALCVDDTNPSCADDARTAGTIYSVAALSNTLDLAESYPTKDQTLEAGDVVVIDPENSQYVKKSTVPYEPGVLGIVSTEPGFWLGGFDSERFKGEVKLPIALAGRVPLKVSTENGVIKIGDKLTSGSQPGVAMKATGEGPAIGIALGSFSASESGTIIAFVNLGWNNKITKLNIQEKNGQIKSLDNPTDFADRSLMRVAAIMGSNNKWMIDESGRFISRLTTSEGDKDMIALASPVAEFIFSSSTELVAGTAQIIFDQVTREIIDPTVPLKITVTLTSPAASGLYVSEKTAQGFTIKEIGGGVSNATFDWMVVARRRPDNALPAPAPEPLFVPPPGGGAMSPQPEPNNSIIPETPAPSPEPTPTPAPEITPPPAEPISPPPEAIPTPSPFSESPAPEPTPTP
ncbi:MAG: hypothetical protein EXS55_04060 [Candidatus Magasanikbacteria bacterium]|nr:hypothetical protein [Candidatus Magasanikbacteria bacterium]